MPLCHFRLRAQPISLPTQPPYITTELTRLTRLIAVDPSPVYAHVTAYHARHTFRPVSFHATSHAASLPACRAPHFVSTHIHSRRSSRQHTRLALIRLIRLPCGSASIGSPQQSMRTKASLQGCTSCDTQATPKQLQVSRRFHGTPPRYPFSLPFFMPLFVRSKSCRVKAPGAGPDEP